MTTRQQVIDIARGWIGTPWRHQAMLRGAGCDCVGFVRGVLLEIGIDIGPVTAYSRYPRGDRLLTELDKHAARTDAPKIADVLVFVGYKDPRHIGIMTDCGVIHSHHQHGVVETSFHPELLIAAYTMPGVQ